MPKLRRTSQWMSFCLLSVASLFLSQISRANETVLSRISEDVKYLASDELEGRGIGTKGLDKAADYIRAEFQKLGIQSAVEDGTYFQQMEIPDSIFADPEQTKIEIAYSQDQKQTLNLKTDFSPYTIGGTGTVEGNLYFAGYGIQAPDFQYDDYAGQDLKGKIVVILRYEPQQGKEDSVFAGMEITKHSYLRTKLKLAQDQGAAAVIMVNPPFTTKEKPDELEPEDKFGKSSFEIPFLQISQDVFNTLLTHSPIKSSDGKPLATLQDVETELDQNLKPISQPMGNIHLSLNVQFEKKYAQVYNVAGYLPGHGPHAEEAIVIGAHYDHLGYGGAGSLAGGVTAIHNGADDNASGTAALLEMARRIATRRSLLPRRVIFIAFTAEERGLLGSDYYVEHPLYPLEKTVAMLNFDMVGNLQEDQLTVYGTGTAKEFDALVESANESTKLKLNKIEGVMGASDHYSFFRHDIPCFHFFSGFTQEYHTPSDDFETLNIAGMEKIIQFSLNLFDNVVQLESAPEYVKTEKPESHMGRGGMAYLGVLPNYTADVKGLLLNGVKEKSPAETAGLKGGDIITKFGEITVSDIQGLADGLRQYKPRETITVIVKRKKPDSEETEEVSLKVTLGDAGSN
ncbi:MAG: M20/M25/M40 family metallo-hydrolase [Planctomycetaceae bacterium]|nr:M20/M25/M40 family metallo-hydrolase [Planctomycetaceae bacterium]